MNVQNILSNVITAEDCEKIINKHTNEQTELITYKLEKVSETVLGYLGDHFRLTVIFKTKTAPQVQKATFFVKTLPQFNQNQNDYVLEMGIFEKESLVYKNLLSEFLKLTQNKFTAKYCYIKHDQSLVLEDLGAKGFEVCNTPYRSLVQGEAIMRTMGSFHAATVIYEQMRHCRLDEKFSKELRETTFSFIEGHPRQKWCFSVTQCLTDCIRLMSDVIDADQICAKLTEFVIEEFPKIIQPSNKFRNVLVHDDLHNNNMLFNKNSDCVFVDFQLVRYNVPAMDLLLAIYLNFTSQIIEEKMDYLIDVYYESFSNELRQYHFVADQLLPKTEIIESLTYYKLPCLIEAAMYGTNVFLPDDVSTFIVTDVNVFKEFTFLNRSKYIRQLYVENATFRDRWNCVLKPLVKALTD